MKRPAATAVERACAIDSARERRGEREWLRLPVPGELPATFDPDKRILVTVLGLGVRMRMVVRITSPMPEGVQ